MNRQNLITELTKAEQTQREAAAHIERLRKMLDEPEGVWRPKDGEPYWSINPWKGADNYTKLKATDDNDKHCESIGFCFPTKEAAELHVKKLKVIQKLRELAGGFRPDWKDSHTRKWFIAYNHEKKNWQTDSNYWLQGNHVYFETEAAAQAAITTLGDELNCLLEG